MTRPTDSPTIPVIGLVGGVGSGKSAVAEQMARAGLSVIDADRIGHELLTHGPVRDRIIARWGPGVLDASGQVDRGALGRIVFADGDELAALNEIMHPRIGRRIGERIAEIRREGEAPGIVLDAAVLLEAGWDRYCDELVYVDAPAEQRLARVRAHRGWDLATWQKREKAQNSLDMKSLRCCHVVDNSSSLPHLRRQVRKLLHERFHVSEDS